MEVDSEVEDASMEVDSEVDDAGVLERVKEISRLRGQGKKKDADRLQSQLRAEGAEATSKGQVTRYSKQMQDLLFAFGDYQVTEVHRAFFPVIKHLCIAPVFDCAAQARRVGPRAALYRM